jgi:SAM-dependent methyltransferase
VPVCPICQDKSITPRWKVGDAWIDYCGDCQAYIRRDSRPGQDLPAPDRFGTWWSGTGNAAIADLKRSTAHWHLQRLERIAKKGRLLEVGCGSGDLLQAAAVRGWVAEGLDTAPAAVSAAREKGLQVRLGSLDSAGLASRTYDVVVLMDVLEHTDDPQGMLEHAHRVLVSDGWLLLATPDARSFSASLLGSWWPMFIPDHRVCFTRDGLVKLLRRTGFTPHPVWPSLRAVSLAYLAAHLRHDPRRWLSRLGWVLEKAVPHSLAAWPARLPLGSCAVLACARDQ